MKNPRFEDENFCLSSPDIDKIPCKDCSFRAEDRFNGKMKGATLGVCSVYDIKPNEILWEGHDCPYYVRGGTDE